MEEIKKELVSILSERCRGLSLSFLFLTYFLLSSPGSVRFFHFASLLHSFFHSFLYLFATSHHFYTFFDSIPIFSLRSSPSLYAQGGRIALHKAARFGQTSVTRYLVELGVNVNATDDVSQ